MHEVVPIPVVDLILDPGNARLGEEQPSQQAVYQALSEQQGARLVELAADVVESGLDPTALPAVVATADRRRKYKVIEGNRRILAVKALDNPSIVAVGLSPRDHTKLTALARRYADDPIAEISCVLFDSEEEAYHWVELRHTGANDGAGLVEWNSNEQDRFKARHGKGGQRRPAGQILDFLEQVDGPPTGKKSVMTTIQRIINTKEIREALGIETKGGVVVSHYPSEQVLKGLRRMVGDLTSETIKVKDVYDAEDRKKYIAGFGPSDLPDPATRLPDPRPLSELDAPSSSGARPKKKATRRRKPPVTRTSIVPSTCAINPAPPRINNIFNELTALDADTFPNAGAVLLRVFLELSVDHEITTNGLMTEEQRRKDSLSKRLKVVAGEMRRNGRIEPQLEAAIIKVADSQHTLAASTVTFNQYVHNKFVFPKPSEVRTAWDELQPFLEKVWE
jgi:hypothetical protein